MTTKAKELDNRKQGDRAACPVCVPPELRGRIPAWRVWAFSLSHPGVQVFR